MDNTQEHKGKASRDTKAKKEPKETLKIKNAIIEIKNGFDGFSRSWTWLRKESEKFLKLK